MSASQIALGVVIGGIVSSSFGSSLKNVDSSLTKYQDKIKSLNKDKLILKAQNDPKNAAAISSINQQLLALRKSAKIRIALESKKEDLIAQKVDGIFLNPTDWKAIKPALEMAKKAGIPVYVVDAPVFNDDLVKTTIVSDNWNAGTLCALHLTQTLGITEGNIVVLEHPTAKSAIERTNSFLKEIAKYPNLKVIAKQSSEGQLEIAMSIMEDIIKMNTNITAIMAENDPTALGVVAALERLNKLKSVKAIYGVDGSSDAYKLIEAGKMTATAAQYPKEIGKIAAESAYKFISGEKISKEIKIPVKLITLEDIK